MSARFWVVGVVLGTLTPIALATVPTEPIRLASLTVVKRPPPARNAMRISTRPDETVIDYPTAESKDGVVLAVDRCLAWGEQCDQPAADAVCRKYAPDRPVAARYSLLQNAGATVIQSTREHCWDTYCTGLAQVRCIAKPAPIRTGGVADARMSGSIVSSAAVVAAPATVATPAADPNTCKSGYVWREARPADLVCVTPDARQRTAGENAAAGSRVDPNGAYGPATCISGYVWREAFEGDTVCVTPETRDLVRSENQAASTRRVGN
jgi:hypothetical protein